MKYIISKNGDSYAYIGEKVITRGVDAFPTILFDLSGSYRCNDMTVAQAQAIVDALTAAISTAAPQVPDIELPSTEVEPGTILTAVVTLDGEDFRLVNWSDFRGWEVRRAEAQAVTLGYLTMLLDAPGVGTDTYTVRTAGRRFGYGSPSFEQSGFTRIDDALRALIANT